MQLVIKCLLPSGFLLGRLVSPFLIVQSIEYSSQLPTIEPEILPFFVLNEIVEPTCIELILMSLPFEFKVNIYLLIVRKKIVL